MTKYLVYNIRTGKIVNMYFFIKVFTLLAFSLIAVLFLYYIPVFANVEFDSSTGILTLSGDVTVDEISQYRENSEVKTVKVAEEGAVLPENSEGLFEYIYAQTIDLKGVDTSNVTDMGYMFYYCSKLVSLDLSSLDTSNVTNMRNMFYNCYYLTSLDLSSFNTENVNDMSYMFCYCNKLTNLDLSSFDTGNVTNMSDMFDYCNNLTSLDISGFDTKNVTDMSHMFYSCSSLTNLNLSIFGTGNVTDMSHMFDYCNNLTSLDISGFDTKNVTDMSYMFYSCSSLTNLNLSIFGTGNVTDMSHMFSSCSRLKYILVSNKWSTENVTSSTSMFYNCYLLTGENATVYDSTYTDKTYARLDTEETPGYLSENTPLPTVSFDETTGELKLLRGKVRARDVQYYANNTAVKSVVAEDGAILPVNSSALFSDFRANTIDLNNVDTSNVINMRYMFSNCSSLTSLDISGFDTGNVTDMCGMFYYCSNLTSLDISRFDTGNVTDMRYMFYNCSKLNYILVSNKWRTENVISSTSMFGNCDLLTGENATIYDTEYTDKTYARLDTEETPGYLSENIPLPSVSFDETTGELELLRGKVRAKDVRCYANNTAVKSVVAEYGAILPANSSELFRKFRATVIDLSNVDTSNVTNMNNMFRECNSLTSLDISGFDTCNVTDMRYMFYNCSKLNYILVSNKWRTENVISSTSMFGNCNLLTGENATIYDTEYTDKTYARLDTEETPGYLSENIPLSTVSFDETTGELKLLRGKVRARDVQYYANNTAVKSVVAEEGAILPVNSSELFSDFRANAIDLSNVDTSNVTNMSSMFSDCRSLTSLDLRVFDTRNVTDMSRMFYNCSKLNYILISEKWNTDNVTSSWYMFYCCSSLTGENSTVYNSTYTDKTYARLDTDEAPGYLSENPLLSSVSFDETTGELKLLRGKVRARDVQYYANNTAVKSVVAEDGAILPINSSKLFRDFKAETINFGNVDTSNVTNMRYMFDRCRNLTNLDTSGFNTENVTNMSYMFYSCYNLTNLDISGFNTENVTDMSNMFFDCSKLKYILVSEKWNTDNVTSSSDMFYNCTPLMGENYTVYDSTYTDKTYARLDTEETPGYLSENIPLSTVSFDETIGELKLLSGKVRSGDVKYYAENGNVRSVVAEDGAILPVNSSELFKNFKATSIDLSNVDTENVTDISYIFSDCNNLTSLDISSFDTGNVTDMSYAFHNCSNLTNLDLRSFDTGNVTDMSNMFYGCSNLNYILVSNKWNTENVTSSSSMFYDCNLLTGENATIFDIGYTDKTYARLDTDEAPGYLSENPLLSSISFDETTGELKLLKGKVRARDVQYYANNTAVKSVVAEDGAILPVNSSALFSDFRANAIDLNNVDTSNVINMRYMFSNCCSLTSLDISGFDTGNVTDMSYMFYNCSNLTSLDISSFDTGNVTDMSYMFYNCSNLNYILVSNKWNTENVTSSSSMFYDCNLLTGENATIFDIRYTDKTYARLDTEETTGYLSENIPSSTVFFDEVTGELRLLKGKVRARDVKYYARNKNVKSVVAEAGAILPTNSSELFKNFKATSIDLSNVDTENVTDISYIFSDCNNLTSLDISSFDTGNVTDMSYMFSYCKNLTNLNIRSFDTGNVTDMSSMFSSCYNLTSIDLSSFDTSNVTNMSYMFSGCEKVKALDLSGFDTSNVTYMSYMFSGCSYLKNLDLSTFNTSNVTNMAGMFYNCKNITNFDLSTFDTSNVTNMDSMFYDCYKLTSLDLSSFNTGNVTDMSYMFYDCTHLTNLNLSSFDTSNVTDMNHMFYDCYKLTGLDLSSFDTGNVTDMGSMFNKCSILKYILISSKWNTENVTSSSSMFYNCNLITGENATVYDEAYTDKTYARLDTEYMPGYLSEGIPLPTVSFDETTGELKLLSGKIRALDVKDYAGNGNVKSVVAEDGAILPANSSELFENYMASTIDLSNVDTQNVTNMSNMFNSCSGLTSLNLSGFDTGNVTDMSNMFYDCSKLKYILVSKKWNTDNVTSSSKMFYRCTLLTGENYTGYDSTYTDKTYARLDTEETPGYLSENVPSITVSFDEVTGKLKLLRGKVRAGDVKYYARNENVKSVVAEDGAILPVNSSELFKNFRANVIDFSNVDTSNVTNMSNMFSGCSSLTGLDLSGFNTGNVTDMSNMFYDCSKLKYILVSEKWNTDNVTSSSGMFYWCSSLTGENYTGYDSTYTDKTYARLDTEETPGYLSENVPSITVSFDEVTGELKLLSGKVRAGDVKYYAGNENVKSVVAEDGAILPANSSELFKNYMVSTIDLNNIDTSNVTNMSYMFYYCYNLTSLDLSGFNTGNVTDMSYMFYDCSKLKYILVSNKWSTEKVSSSYSMFYNCKLLTGENYTGYDSPYTDKTYARLDTEETPGYLSENIPSATVSFDEVTGELKLLSGKVKAGDVKYYAGNENVKSVVAEDGAILPTNSSELFKNYKATSIDLSNVDTRNVTDMSSMFSSCYNLTSLDLSGFDTGNVTNMSYMFYNCYNLTSLDLSGFDTGNVTNMSYMFGYCSKLTNLDLSGFNTSNVTNMNSMFYCCYSLTNIDLSSFNTGDVTSMNSMFRECNELTNLDLSGFDTGNVTDMRHMFGACSSLTNLDLSGFDTGNVTDMRHMFSNCNSLTNLDLSNFDTSNVTSMSYMFNMFNNCNKLHTIILGEKFTEIGTGCYLPAGEGWVSSNAENEIITGNTYIAITNTGNNTWRKLYSVSYDVGEYGTAPESELVYGGEKAQIPETPIAVPHTFMGWFNDSSYAEVYDFDMPVESNVLLYGKWATVAENSFTVQDGKTFNVYYGDDIVIYPPENTNIAQGKWEVYVGGNAVETIQDQNTIKILAKAVPAKTTAKVVYTFTDEEGETKYRFYIKSVYKKGDINGDGAVDKDDATVYIKYINGTDKFTDEYSVADVNRDLKYDMLDVIEILKTVA